MSTTPIAQLTTPVVLGMSFNWLLFGILTTQTYYYSIHFKNDKIGIKALVYGLYLWETAQTALVGYYGHYLLGVGWGNPAALVYGTNIWFTVPFMSGIISMTVQCFFAWRIYYLSGLKVLAAVIVMISLASGGAALADGLILKVILHDNLTLLQARLYAADSVWLLGSAACDLLICTCMTIWYWRTRRTGVISSITDDIITKVVRLTIATGSLTTAVALIDSALFLAFQNNNYHFTPAMALGKLYSNTMLALLNQRYRVECGDTTQYFYDADLHAVGAKSDGSWAAGILNSRSFKRAHDGPRHLAVTISSSGETKVDSIITHKSTNADPGVAELDLQLEKERSTDKVVMIA